MTIKIFIAPSTLTPTLSHHKGRGREKKPSLDHPVMLRIPPLQWRGIKEVLKNRSPLPRRERVRVEIFFSRFVEASIIFPYRLRGRPLFLYPLPLAGEGSERSERVGVYY
jgi:hypothetical protein